MIKSKQFWISAILMAIIPWLAIDIIQHYLDWQKDVRWELIDTVQNTYTLNKQQKAEILDRVFAANQRLGSLIYIKSFCILLLLAASIYFFRSYRRKQRPSFLKPAFYTIAVMSCFLLIKIFVVNKINTNHSIQILTINAGDSTLANICNNHFKGKVMYVDFWGTTCGPCLAEFRNFTQPLKEKFKNRADINYLYVAQGNKYIWHEQLNKYQVNGYHLFVDESQYEKLYRQSTKDSMVLMPHYLIIDKAGNIAEPNARRPSEGDSLYRQLDKYLSQR